MLFAFACRALHFSVAVLKSVVVDTHEAENFGFEVVPSPSDGFPAE